MRSHSRHFIRFYDHESSHTVMARDFLAAGREAGETTILFAPESLRNRLKELCDRDDSDDTGGLASDSYINMDPAEILAQYPLDESRLQHSAERFAALLKSRAGKDNGRVCIFGAMAGWLYADGQTEAAKRLEDFWNRVAEIQPIHLCCSYNWPPALDNKFATRAFMAVCAEHTALEFPQARKDSPDVQRPFADISPATEPVCPSPA